MRFLLLRFLSKLVNLKKLEFSELTETELLVALSQGNATEGSL